MEMHKFMNAVELRSVFLSRFRPSNDFVHSENSDRRSFRRSSHFLARRALTAVSREKKRGEEKKRRKRRSCLALFIFGIFVEKCNWAVCVWMLMY